MDTSNNHFYLSQLNIDISATVLTIPGGEDTTVIESNCYAELDCPVSFARHFLQYQTDAIDVNDLNSSDLKFRTFHISDASGNTFGNIDDITYYNARNLLVAEAVTYSGAKTFYGSASATTDEKKVGADYERHISEEMFGTTAGADIFDNGRAFRLHFLQESVNAFVAKLNDLSTIVAMWNDGGTNDLNYDDHPAKAAFKQMIKNYPERFANDGVANDVADMKHIYDESGNDISVNIEDASGGTLPIWRYMPFVAGDKIFFQLRADPNSAQSDVLQTDQPITLTSRTYSIRLNIVDNVTASTTNGNYVRAWDTTGPDFSLEPEYLHEQLNETVEP